MYSVLKRLERFSSATLAVFCVAIILIIGVGDYATGDELDFTIFYFLPILVVSWLGRLVLARTISVLSAFERVATDVLAGHVYAHPSIPYWNAFAHLLVFLSVVYVIRQLRHLYDAEAALSRTDALTGVANMRQLVDFASSAIERAKRRPFDVTAVYLDLDNFKWVNDNLGHRVGDELLIVVAQALRAGVRNVDLVARIGGDEFIIIMPEISHQHAMDAVRRIKAGVLAGINKRGWPVTISVGVATFGAPIAGVNDMIVQADKLMYEAKRAGKNQIVGQVIEAATPLESNG